LSPTRKICAPIGTCSTPCKPRELGPADDLIGDQHVGYAGRDERFGFADFLTANADRAVSDLALGDLGTLVTLGVRAKPHIPAANRCSHGGEVALEEVEIDDERRSVDLGEGVTHLRRHARRHRRGGYFGAAASSTANCP
jgi:hypothetical protein